MDRCDVRMELRRLVSKIASQLEDEERLRDELMSLTRQIIKVSGDATVALHQGRSSEAWELVAKTAQLIGQALDLVSDRAEYLFTGPLPQALKEYVEASLLLAFHGETQVPSPEDLKVPVKPYIYGLAEVAGEVRRQVVEAIRKDRLEEAERWFKVLEAIYEALRELEVFRGALPEIKGRVDHVRRLLEATRGDLALTVQQRRLSLELKKIEGRLSRHGQVED